MTESRTITHIIISLEKSVVNTRHFLELKIERGGKVGAIVPLPGGV